jgi:hypothetical protein
MPTTGRSARAAGHRWELDVAAFFNDTSAIQELPELEPWTTTRNAAPGSHDDVGDLLDPLHRYAVECKNVGRWSIDAWFRVIESKADRHDLTPVLAVKRRQKPTGDGLIVVRLKDWHR